jgi:O-antigen ligase
MTTSIYNAAAAQPVRGKPQPVESAKETVTAPTKRRHTIASRLIFLMLCVGIVLTTLAYGTVHYWALAAFSLSAAGIVCLWTLDGLVLRSASLSLNRLQWPVLGMIILGLIQLLPLRAPDSAGLAISPARTLSLDPYATRLVIVQVASLFVYFAATLIFVDTPRRLRTLVRTIMIFGFLLAMFGLTQSLTTDGTRVYWFRQLTQSTAFGPFINRHHFAGYMELAIALPLGLLFTGAVEKPKRVLYVFVALLMGVALLMTNSRGGVISLGAEILFLAVVGTTARSRHGQRLPRSERARAAMVRAGLAFMLIVALIGGAVAFGGADIFTRLLGTPTASDPTTGRAHFWSVALDVIKAYPITGSGLGSFGVIYTRYDSRNGLFRLEQAHNDYLQTLSDGGIIGAALGLCFILILFRRGFAGRETHDHFRRGVITGALAGCFAVLVHSFFDFTLHTTANALLFLILAALATQDSRVDQTSQHRPRRPSLSETAPAELAAATH